MTVSYTHLRLADTTTIVTAYKSTKKEDLAKVKKSIENVGRCV